MRGAAWEAVPSVRKERGEKVHEGGQGALIDRGVRGGSLVSRYLTVAHKVWIVRREKPWLPSVTSLLSYFSCIERASHPAQLTDSSGEQPLLTLPKTTDRPD